MAEEASMVEDNEETPSGFHPVVDLILARMESNPQEFTLGNGWWKPKIEEVKQYLSNEEKVAINAGLRKIYLDALHQQIMKRLLDPTGEAEKETLWQMMAGQKYARPVQSNYPRGQGLYDPTNAPWAYADTLTGSTASAPSSAPPGSLWDMIKHWGTGK